MATFFGEVVLPTSRVFFDDGDDSDLETEDNDNFDRRIEYQISKEFSGDKNARYSFLIIGDGPVAVDFADNHLCNSKTLLMELTLKNDNDSDLGLPKRKPNTIRLYALKDDTLFLEVQKSVELSHANRLTTMLVDVLNAANEIVIVSSKSSQDFKNSSSASNLPPAFIRYLRSSSAEKPKSGQQLELPNFVTGFSASVLYWSEAFKKPCKLHVCYSDTVFTDTITTKPLLDLFKSEYPSLLIDKGINTSTHSHNPTHLFNMYQ